MVDLLADILQRSELREKDIEVPSTPYRPTLHKTLYIHSLFLRHLTQLLTTLTSLHFTYRMLSPIPKL